MTITDPIPAALALPGEAEPLSEEQIEQGLQSWEPSEGGQLPYAEEEPDTLREELRPVARFEITDDGLAEWGLRKLAEIEAREGEIEERAEGWIEEIRAWRAQQLAPLSRRRAFFEGHLTAYLRRLRAESGGKIKSRSLPSGTIKSTGSGPKVAIADEAAVIAWAREHLEGEELEAVVKVVEKAQVSELRKIASVSERVVGLRWEISLACGHAFERIRPERAEGEEAPEEELEPVPAEGELVRCSACEPEFGEAPERAVESVAASELLEAVVRDEDTGQEIPGAVVQPPSVSFSVKVGG